MSPGRFYIDRTKKKEHNTKISTVLKIYGDIDKAENSQKKTIFFYVTEKILYRQDKKKNTYTKISTVKNIWGYR